MKIFAMATLALLSTLASTALAQFNPGAIIGANDGCVDINQSFLGRGAEAQLWWPCTTYPNQDFFFRHIGFNEFQIVARHSALCLSIEDASQADGAKVIQYECTYEGFALFEVEEVETDLFQIRALHSQKCIHAVIEGEEQGNELVQLPCNGRPESKFRINADVDNTVNPFRYIRSQNRQANLCPTVRANDPREAGNIFLWNCRQRDEAEMWQFIRVIGNFYQIVNRNNNKCMGLYGRNVVQWSCCVENHQLWRIGQGKIINRSNNQCLNNQFGHFRRGDNLITWPCHTHGSDLPSRFDIVLEQNI